MTFCQLPQKRLITNTEIEKTHVPSSTHYSAKTIISVPTTFPLLSYFDKNLRFLSVHISICTSKDSLKIYSQFSFFFSLYMCIYIYSLYISTQIFKWDLLYVISHICQLILPHFLSTHKTFPIVSSICTILSLLCLIYYILVLCVLNQCHFYCSFSQSISLFIYTLVYPITLHPFLFPLE